MFDFFDMLDLYEDREPCFDFRRGMGSYYGFQKSLGVWGK